MMNICTEFQFEEKIKFTDSAVVVVIFLSGHRNKQNWYQTICTGSVITEILAIPASKCSLLQN